MTWFSTAEWAWLATTALVTSASYQTGVWSWARIEQKCPNFARKCQKLVEKLRNWR